MRYDLQQTLAGAAFTRASLSKANVTQSSLPLESATPARRTFFRQWSTCARLFNSLPAMEHVHCGVMALGQESRGFCRPRNARREQTRHQRKTIFAAEPLFTAFFTTLCHELPSSLSDTGRLKKLGLSSMILSLLPSVPSSCGRILSSASADFFAPDRISLHFAKPPENNC